MSVVLARVPKGYYRVGGKVLGVVVRLPGESDYVKDMHGSIIVFRSIGDIIDAMPTSFSVDDVTTVKVVLGIKKRRSKKKATV